MCNNKDYYNFVGVVVDKVLRSDLIVSTVVRSCSGYQEYEEAFDHTK